MSEPRRLPRPGAVTEHCRLCGAELAVSLENPRRVCVRCGEINLPSEGAVPVAEPRPIATRPGRVKSIGWWPLFTGALPLIAIPVALISRLWGEKWWILSVFGWALSGSTFSCAFFVYLLFSRKKGERFTSLSLWFVGYALAWMAVVAFLRFA